MIRLSTTGHQPLERADALDLRVGGAEVNVAVALTRLGTSAAWISTIPATPLGRRVVSEVAAAGVDTRGVAWTQDGRVGLYFVEFGTRPRPTAVWYDRANSSFAQSCSLPDGAFAGARYVVLSGMTPALSERSALTAFQVIEASRAAGAGLVVDVNYRERLATPEQARETTGALLREAEIVVCSANDAARVFGLLGDDEAVVTELAARFAPQAALVCLTCAERGSVAVDRSGELARAPMVPATIIDRFGSGDAFLAGVIDTLLRDGTVEEALGFGSMLAALNCTIPGDFSLFSRDDVLTATTGEVLRR